MEKQSQHTVSLFYLRGFAAPSGDAILWQYTKGGSRPRRVSPRAAAAEHRFYSIEREDGTWDDAFEDWLAGVERAAANPIRELAAGRELDGDERWIVAYFIGLAFLRVRGYAKHAAGEKAKLEKPEVTLAFLEKSQISRRFPAEVVQRFRDEILLRGRGVSLSPKFYLELVPLRATKYAKLITEMDWTVYRSRTDFFVTSDNPAFARRPDSLADPGLVGLERKDLGVELGFPLSRDSLLLVHWGNLRVGYQRAAPSRVRELNRRTILSAHEHVYSPERSNTIEALMEEHSDFRLSYPVH